MRSYIFTVHLLDRQSEPGSDILAAKTKEKKRKPAANANGVITPKQLVCLRLFFILNCFFPGEKETKKYLVY